MSGPLRLVVAPVAVALVVVALVLGVMRLADPPGEGVGGSDVGSGVGSGGGSGGGAGGSGAPGFPGTGSPEPPATGPTSPPADPDAPMSRFTAVSRAPEDRALSVSFWGGVKDCYRYTVRTEERADVVTLTLREKRVFDGPCIELAQQYDRTVPLDQPLGTRRVVDAGTGETLLGPSR